MAARKFKASVQKHRVVLMLPKGITTEPPGSSGTFTPKFDVVLTAESGVSSRVQIVPFDITLDGKRHGELFDYLVLAKE